MKNYLFVIASTIVLSMTPLSFANQETYNLEVDGKTFDISYILDGELIAMDVDQEIISLLVGIENVEDSVFEISFPSELLSAQNAEFVVLIDGLETDYTVTYNGDSPALTFPIPADSEEIEIIGTSVIPEFPLGALAIMGAVSATAIILTRMRQIFFK